MRADAIAAANARLITAQAAVPIVKFWGEGLLASVDGLRFVVPVRTVSPAPSPKYFGFKRGITWLNAVNDPGAATAAEPPASDSAIRIASWTTGRVSGSISARGRAAVPPPACGAVRAERLRGERVARTG